jgi:hypothetical protein
MQKADLGAACEGFAATCMEDGATDLVQGFLMMVARIIKMIPDNMS